MSIKQINKKIKKMPPDLLSEVMDYIDYLMYKYSSVSKDKKPFDFSWEGGLIEISKKYTSVDLQHKALEWR
ncbi:MAG TPA: DUF2281 domain-containing protein [Ignavibacteria bacterium]|nr:DUF2281 domain-containing protein [Ignavibacteria bacterium]